jgi:hypothetical protein
MKKIIFLAFLVAVALLLMVSDTVIGGRRGGGGGGRGGGAGAARPVGGGAVNPYGGGSYGGRSTPIVGPAGGTGQAARGGGSYTTNRGATINYKGAAIGGTTPGGVQGGKYVGGIQVTTPGGRDVTKVGTGGAIAGPGGGVVAGKSGATVGSGPNGAFANRYQGGVAIGPQGGVTAGGARFGAAAGPYGAVAGRSTVVAGRGTYYHSTALMRGQAVYVRQGVARYPCFRPGWYRNYPGAWFAAGWAANSVWRAATWGACASYCGYPVEPIYYDYGETVVYQDNSVTIAGEPVASPEEYAEQAIVLADAGRDAKVSKEEEWLPLGVFAMVQGEEKTSNHIFQLAVNKQGVIRGNYYDAVTDSTALIFGEVDKKTQRAAWTVGDRKTPIYEAGIANLTRNETTMLVHYGKDRTQQFSLIRIEEPEGKDAK